MTRSFFNVAAVQLARAAGMTVVGTGDTVRGRRLVAKQGAHHVLAHRAAGRLDQVRALTNGPAGRVVVIGSRGTVEIDPRAAMMRDASILGMSLLNAPEDDAAQIHRALVAGLENGTLRPVVGQEMPLAEAPRAHQAVMEPGAYGKIVLIP